MLSSLEAVKRDQRANRWKAEASIEEVERLLAYMKGEL